MAPWVQCNQLRRPTREGRGLDNHACKPFRWQFAEIFTSMTRGAMLPNLNVARCRPWQLHILIDHRNVVSKGIFHFIAEGKMNDIHIIGEERIEQSILLVRGQKVLLDVDLAELYGVPTKRLNEQVR